MVRHYPERLCVSGILSFRGLLLGGSATPVVAARYWRIFINASDGGPFAGFTRIQMATSLGGINLIVAQIANVDPPLLGSSEINGSNAVYMASDAILTDGWLAATNANEWWSYDFIADQAIASVVITGSFNSPSSSPKDFLIESSPDRSTWTTIHTVTGQTGWTGATDVRTFSF